MADEARLKIVSLDSPQFNLEDALQDAAEDQVVFLTEGGQPRFALVAVDDGDREALALRSNAEFLANLDESKLRARSGPSKSLEEIRRLSPPDEPSAESKA
jgi:hypothetical protein